MLPLTKPILNFYINHIVAAVFWLSIAACGNLFYKQIISKHIQKGKLGDILHHVQKRASGLYLVPTFILHLN